MPGEQESERELEPLLRQVLRQGAATSASPCPEPDVFASWADGTLRADESLAFEAHAAGCDRCRAILAAFIRTDVPAVAPGPVEAAEPPVPFWRRWRLAYLVPVAATATAIAIYVAAPTTPATPPTAAELRSREVPSPELAEGPSPQGRAEMPLTAPREQPVTPGPLAEAGIEATADAAAGNVARTEPARTTAEAAASAVAPPAAPKVAEAPPQAASADAASPGAIAAAPAPPAESFAERSLSVAQPRAFAAPGPRVLVGSASTGGAGQWRVSGSAGEARLERSVEGGQWDVVSLPPGVDAGALLAVAATAPDAWLVGRAGLVMYAADGRTFVQVPAPAPVDLNVVQALGPAAARVTAADGRAFVTRTAGREWTAP